MFAVRTDWRPRGPLPAVVALALAIAAVTVLTSVVPSGVTGARLTGPATGGQVPGVQPEGAGSPTLSMVGASPTTAGLSWSATSDLTFSKYEVQQSTSSSSGPWSTIATLSSQSATSYYASGLAPSTTSWWEVVEVDALGVTMASNAVQYAQPANATLSVALLTSSSVHLSWVNHAAYGGSIQFDSYTIWQSVGGGAATSIGTITAEGTTTADPGGLTTGTAYTFRVETTDGCSKATNCGSTTPSALSYSNSVTETATAVAPENFSVTFSESGLPSGASWSIALNGSSKSATASSIAFSSPNGSYTYTVGAVKGYTATPSSGSVTVSGSAITRTETFRSAAPGTHPVTFSESGLPAGTSWAVTLNASTQSSTGSTVAFTETNGTYAYSVAAPSGYSATPASGSLTVAGVSVNVSVAFAYASGSAATSISHVVLILLENEETTDLWAAGPYERYLAGEYGNATEFFATCHDSSADYLAVTSGRTFGCGTVYPNPGFNVTEIGDLFEAHNLSWLAYQESMPSACDASSSGYYINYHDPFVYYQDLNRNLTRCDAHVVSASSFNQSVEDGELPAFSFYTPNWEHDGHGPTNSPWSASTGLTHIESWLRGFLPPILNHTGAFDTATERAMVNHTAFVLLYDEGTTDLGYTAGSVYTPGCYNQTGKYVTACGGHVQVTVISPYSVHRQFTQDATTYNVESTVEWLFGLPGDGGWDGSSDFPPMSSLFSFSSNDYSTVHARSAAPPSGAYGPSAPHRPSGPLGAGTNLPLTLMVSGGLGASVAVLATRAYTLARVRAQRREPHESRGAIPSVGGPPPRSTTSASRTPAPSPRTQVSPTDRAGSGSEGGTDPSQG